MLENGGSRFQKLGYTSVGENLDRLVSYDGSGFIDNINKISNGDPEIMQDIVKNTSSPHAVDCSNIYLNDSDLSDIRFLYSFSLTVTNNNFLVSLSSNTSLVLSKEETTTLELISLPPFLTCIQAVF